MPAFYAENGMPYWLEYVATDVARTGEFCTSVLGWAVDETTSKATIFNVPIARIGRSEELNEWIVFFRHPNLAEAMEAVANGGGEIVREPLTDERGTTIIASDPAGGFFGLIQPEGREQFVAAGEPGTPVWYELTTPADTLDATLEFYSAVCGWNLSTVANDAGQRYTTAHYDGQPYLGIYPSQDDARTLWHVYFGVDDLEKSLDKLHASGGTVHQRPVETEFGLLATATDGGGAGIVLVELPDLNAELGGEVEL